MPAFVYYRRGHDVLDKWRAADSSIGACGGTPTFAARTNGARASSGGSTTTCCVRRRRTFCRP